VKIYLLNWTEHELHEEIEHFPSLVGTRAFVREDCEPLRSLARARLATASAYKFGLGSVGESVMSWSVRTIFATLVFAGIAATPAFSPLLSQIQDRDRPEFRPAISGEALPVPDESTTRVPPPWVGHYSLIAHYGEYRLSELSEPPSSALSAGQWSEASCCSSGCKSRRHRSPIDVVVISSGGEGD